LPLISRLEEAPGVKSVSAISLSPLSSDRDLTGFSIEGIATTTDELFPYITDWRAVTPGYFETMGMQLIRRAPLQRILFNTSGLQAIGLSMAKTRGKIAIYGTGSQVPICGIGAPEPPKAVLQASDRIAAFYVCIAKCRFLRQHLPKV
jgi:hypothetical protein